MTEVIATSASRRNSPGCGGVHDRRRNGNSQSGLCDAPARFHGRSAVRPTVAKNLGEAVRIVRIHHLSIFLTDAPRRGRTVQYMGRDTANQPIAKSALC